MTVLSPSQFNYTVTVHTMQEAGRTLLLFRTRVLAPLYELLALHQNGDSNKTRLQSFWFWVYFVLFCFSVLSCLLPSYAFSLQTVLQLKENLISVISSAAATNHFWKKIEGQFRSWTDRVLQHSADHFQESIANTEQHLSVNSACSTMEGKPSWWWFISALPTY